MRVIDEARTLYKSRTSPIDFSSHSLPAVHLHREQQRPGLPLIFRDAWCVSLLRSFQPILKNYVQHCLLQHVMSSKWFQMRYNSLPSIRANSVDPVGMEVDNIVPDGQRHDEVVINVSFGAASRGRVASIKSRRGQDPYPRQLLVPESVSETQNLDPMATNQFTTVSPLKMAVPRPTALHSITSHNNAIQPDAPRGTREAIREADRAHRIHLKKTYQGQMNQRSVEQKVFGEDQESNGRYQRPSRRCSSSMRLQYESDQHAGGARKRRSYRNRQTQPDAQVEQLTHQYNGMRLHSESPLPASDALEEFLVRLGLGDHARFFRSFGISSDSDLDRLADDLVREGLEYSKLALILGALEDRTDRNRWINGQRFDDRRDYPARYNQQDNRRHENYRNNWGGRDKWVSQSHDDRTRQRKWNERPRRSDCVNRGHECSYSETPYHGRRPY